MVHATIQAFELAERMICNTHGVTRAECRNVHRLVSVGTTAAVGASIGGLLGGRDGAVIGGVFGLVLGASYPEFAEWVRTQNLARQVHLLQP
jgi:hypothetical protein